jgi:hypothetical protein
MAMCLRILVDIATATIRPRARARNLRALAMMPARSAFELLRASRRYTLNPVRRPASK